MQILNADTETLLVRLTHEEAQRIGAALHLYHGAAELYHLAVSPDTVEIANALLWHSTAAHLHTRQQAKGAWWRRVWHWLTGTDLSTTAEGGADSPPATSHTQE